MQFGDSGGNFSDDDFSPRRSLRICYGWAMIEIHRPYSPIRLCAMMHNQKRKIGISQKMSGPLRNTRHEAFAKALFERPKTGMTLAQCYESAGYKTKGHASETMASRLSFAEHIQARVSELQGVVARKAVISIESICAELDEANIVAKAHGQAGAMVSASTLRAKLAGLLTDKVEISGPEPFRQCKTMADLGENTLRELGV